MEPFEWFDLPNDIIANIPIAEVNPRKSIRFAKPSGIRTTQRTIKSKMSPVVNKFVSQSRTKSGLPHN